MRSRPFLPLLFPLALAVVLTGVVFLAQRRIGLNLADEGFLWEGAVLTAHGKVPLRDFYSYDPGRYLWAAAWSKLLGEGILALRLSTAVFQAAGLFCGLLAARRVLPRAWQLTLAGVLLVLWMEPRHKLFEPALTMAAVYVAVLLIENPTPRRHLLAGAMVGFAGVMGKNHGGYLLLAYSILLLGLHLRRIAPAASGRSTPWSAGGLFIGGIALGALPLLAMMAVVPGFFAAYLDSVLFFVHQGRTNVPLPVPWPWAGSYAGLGWAAALQKLAVGLGFLLLPVSVAAALLFLPGSLPGILPGRTAETARRRALLVAGGTVGVFYLHHAFSRADTFHLSQSIHPVLLALLGLPAALEANFPALRRAAVAVLAPLLAFLTLFAAVPQAPLYLALTATGAGELYVPCRVGEDGLRIQQRTANILGELRTQIDARVPAGEPVLAIPHLPGLYPILGRESPVSDFYPIWPAQGEKDETMLREIREKDVRWLIYSDYSDSLHPALQFPRTHPRVWSHLQASFERVDDPLLPHRIWLMRRREPAKVPGF
jgi:hypothetical protein